MSNSICSVIIPAYNAEKSIQSVLDSLALNGSWKYPIDVQVIDDGSTDRTRQIVERFSECFENVRYCRKENGGVSSARNLGLDTVATKYLVFMDADDEMIRSGLDAMIDTAEQTSADIVISSYYRYNVADGTETKVVCPLKNDILLTKETIEQEILRRFFNEKNKCLPNLWNKLYITDVIRKNGLRFHDKMSHGEDWLFNIEYLRCIDTAYITDAPPLRYSVSGKTDYAKYKGYLANSLIIEFQTAEELNRVYGFCGEQDEDYLLFMRRSVQKAISYLRIKECSRKEKIMFLNSREEQAVFGYMSRLSREALSYLDMSRKDRLAFWLIGHKLFEAGLRLL